MIYGNSVGGGRSSTVDKLIKDFGDLRTQFDVEVSTIDELSGKIDSIQGDVESGAILLANLAEELSTLKADLDYDEIVVSGFKNSVYDSAGTKLSGLKISNIQGLMGKTSILDSGYKCYIRRYELF
jgi:hypothetical protein